MTDVFSPIAAFVRDASEVKRLEIYSERDDDFDGAFPGCRRHVVSAQALRRPEVVEWLSALMAHPDMRGVVHAYRLWEDKYIFYYVDEGIERVWSAIA